MANSSSRPSHSRFKIQILVWFLAGFCAAVNAQTTEQEWQQEAMRRHPALAMSGSPLNAAFVREYQRRKALPSEREFFSHPNWPVLLADECSRSLPAPTGRPAAGHNSPINIIFYVISGIVILGLLLSTVRTLRNGGPAMPSRSRPDAPPSSFTSLNQTRSTISIAALLIGFFLPLLAALQRQAGPLDRPIPRSTPGKNAYLPTSNALIFDASFGNKGLGHLSISNGTQRHAIAKIVDLRTNRKIYSIVIRAKTIGEIDGIRDGDYRLIFAFGDAIIRGTDRFEYPFNYSAFENPLRFVTERSAVSGNRIQMKSTIASVTLHNVIGGNAPKRPISDSEYRAY